MGLRLTNGIKLNKRNQRAFNYFKEQLKDSNLIFKNNSVKVKNVNLLDDLLIKII